MFRLLGILPAAEIEGVANDVAATVFRDKPYQWLNAKTVEEKLDQHLKINEIRANASTRKGIHRVLCQKLSKRLVKECARAHAAELKSGRISESGQFLVHDHMSPWVLIGEHAAHLRHPEKDWEFWYSRPHREWVDSILNTNGLIPDLIEAFEDAFQDWFDKGYIRRVTERAAPIRSILYEVSTKAGAGQ